MPVFVEDMRERAPSKNLVKPTRTSSGLLAGESDMKRFVLLLPLKPEGSLQTNSHVVSWGRWLKHVPERQATRSFGVVNYFKSEMVAGLWQGFTHPAVVNIPLSAYSRSVCRNMALYRSKGWSPSGFTGGQQMSFLPKYLPKGRTGSLAHATHAFSLFQISLCDSTSSTLRSVVDPAPVSVVLYCANTT